MIHPAVRSSAAAAKTRSRSATSRILRPARAIRAGSSPIASGASRPRSLTQATHHFAPAGSLQLCRQRSPAGRTSGSDQVRTCRRLPEIPRGSARLLCGSGAARSGDVERPLRRMPISWSGCMTNHRLPCRLCQQTGLAAGTSRQMTDCTNGWRLELAPWAIGSSGVKGRMEWGPRALCRQPPPLGGDPWQAGGG